MNGNVHFFNPIEDILGISINRPSFSFSYGVVMPECNKELYERCKIKIAIDIVKGKVEPSKEDKMKMGKFHYFNGFPESGELFYERNFIFNRKLQFKISGIDTNDIHLTVNTDYMKFVKHRFMNLHSVGYILTDIVNLRLLHNNLAPLHCSGFSSDNKGYVLFAPPNTGKTLSTMSLCMKDNEKFKFMSEDLGVTDGETFFSVLWTSTFRYYETVDSSRFSRFLNNLTEKISVLELFGFGKTQPITDYVKNVEKSARIYGLFILDRGNKGVYDITQEEAFERINTLDRYEFNYMRSPTIIAYEYFNRKTDIEYAYRREREILKEMISKAAFIKVLSTENALNYPELIQGHMN